MIRTAKRLLLVAVLAIAGMVAAHSAAMAQNTYTCIIVNGCKCYVVLDPCGNIIGIDCPCGSTGSGTFASEAPIPAQGTLNVSLTPQAVNATVVSGTYGAVNTTLDRSRTSDATTITSDNADSRFPATATINFYANATTAAAPGIVYASRTQLQFVATGLQAVNPFKQTTFTLQRDVDFYNTADLSQSTAFTLQANSSTVTLDGDGGNGGDGGIQ